MQIKCSGCSTAIGVPPEAAGKKVRCPKCQTVMMVPAAASGSPAGGARSASKGSASARAQSPGGQGKVIAGCPHCGKKLQLPSNAAGKKVKCPGCSQAFAVPGQSQPAARPAAQAAPAPRAAAPAPTAAPQPSGTPAQSHANGWVPPWETQQTFAPSVMDELTDTDMAPIAAVKVPTDKKDRQSSGSAALNNHVSGSDKAEMDNAARRRAAQSAPVILRIIATGIDWLFAHAPPFVLMFALIAYTAPKVAEGEMNEDYARWTAIIAFMLCELMMHGLNGFLVSLRGQTLGKLLTGIVIVDANTLMPAGFHQGFLTRFFFWQFQKIGIWGTIKQVKDVLALFTSEGVTLHDEYAHTYVIRRKNIGKMA